MFSHIFVGSDDIDRSKAFYDAILSVLGYQKGIIDDKGRCLYHSPNGMFGITKPINGKPASSGNGMTIGFIINSVDDVHKWHKAGIENGGFTCEDPPGIRMNGDVRLYLSYLTDPFGNKLCATHVMPSDDE